MACSHSRPPGSSSSVVIRFRRGSKWKTACRLCSRSACAASTSSPSSATATSRALSPGSPSRRQPSASRCAVALLQRSAVRSSAEKGSRETPSGCDAPGRSSCPVGPQRVDAHPALGQGAGLVGADDVGRAERLDSGQPLHKRPSPGHPPHSDREREGDRRQQSLGDVGDEQADRKGDGVVEGKAGERCSDCEEDEPRGDRDHRRSEARPG